MKYIIIYTVIEKKCDKVLEVVIRTKTKKKSSQNVWTKMKRKGARGRMMMKFRRLEETQA